MKRVVNRTKKLIKGTPLAVLISAAIHAILLFVAAGWVIFTLVEKQEQKFVPQNIKRPQMQLKKLKVRIKESSKPRKAVERITSSRRMAAMPDIQLPEMSMMGTGLELGISGFEMMADLSKMTLFGGSKSLGNDLEGTLYHLMRDRAGNDLPGYDPVDGGPNMKFMDAVNEFVAKDWDTSVLSKFYRSPTKLYATHFTFGTFASDLALKKYGLSDDQYGGLYVIHYKGKIAHPTGGRFRFWGTADDFLFVRINGKMVLDGRTTKGGVYPDWNVDLKTGWQSSAPENCRYPLGVSAAKVGDWFTLEPGVPVEMELMIGEDQGGRTSCYLNIQEEGVEYPKTSYGGPFLPAFKTAPFPPHIVDEIEYLVLPEDVDLSGGPIFSAY